MKEALAAATENPALVKVPTVLVQGEDASGLTGPAAVLTTFSRPGGGRPVATRPVWPGNTRCQTALDVLASILKLD